MASVEQIQSLSNLLRPHLRKPIADEILGAAIDGLTNHSISEQSVSLTQGMPYTEIAKLFKRNPEDVKALLSTVLPSGTRRNVDVYHIRDAANALVKANDDDIIRIIRQMGPKDLPPKLQNAFWDGQIKKLKFEEHAKDLWKTGAVVEILVEVFKSFNMSVKLFVDVTEREQGLTEGQRQSITRMCDEMMRDIRNALQLRVDFKNHKNELQVFSDEERL